MYVNIVVEAFANIRWIRKFEVSNAVVTYRVQLLSQLLSYFSVVKLKNIIFSFIL